MVLLQIRIYVKSETCKSETCKSETCKSETCKSKISILLQNSVNSINIKIY